MRGYKYILFILALLMSASMWGQYNPTNPAEPLAPTAAYTLTLQADPSGGGSFNLNTTTTYSEGVSISLRAYTNSNFTFVSWEEEGGDIVSTSASFNYTMPARNVKLIAHYRYSPSSPTEPSEPVIPEKPVYSNLYLTASPTAGGSFNIGSGNNYEVGTVVNVQATANSNFTFINWTRDGQEVSTSKSFNYTMLSEGNTLTANFRYTPSNPNEPSEAPVSKVYHQLFLQSDPVDGGYFNPESGGRFEEGTSVTVRAYNNQWYTFKNWTLDGEIISTNNTLNYVIPTEDVTLIAHYTYNYNPSNPSEPTTPNVKYLTLYGMAENSMRGQTIVYPIYLENTEEVLGTTVVVKFPDGFTAHTDDVVLGERAAGHAMSIMPLENNAYRFDLTGTTPFTGKNGKLFEVPVTISSTANTDLSYQVQLSNGARINADESKEMISVRSGSIFVKEVKEDGLYASFSYEKLQDRVKFTNLSSANALNFTWDFGDGTTSNERNPLHTYAASGYYDVQLTSKGQTGTDVALMTILINDESSWRVSGVFYLSDEETGVRHFSSAEPLFHLLGRSSIDSNVKIVVKEGMTVDYPLSEENLPFLQNITSSLADGSYSLTISKDGDGNDPTLNFGTASDEITSDLATLFVNLGKSLFLENVNLRLCGIAFNPPAVEQVREQVVSSGQATQLIDFSPISGDMSFSWALASAPEHVSGYTESGSGNIPSMTITSETENIAELTYQITGTYHGITFFEFTHTITVNPVLAGEFTELTPEDNTVLGSTTVTLTWNSIQNAVYDVYLWNAANQQPTTPTVTGTKEHSYTSENFCQDGKTYRWQVIARNAVEQLASDIREFSVRSLPNLHIYSLDYPSDPVAGQKLTVTWTVKNDGLRATKQEETWNDNIWLVPDVYAGTNQKDCKLMATVKNVKPLAVGEQYTGSAELDIDYLQYGSFYLIVASDMSSVTNIEWTSVGGTIVNPYSPTLDGDGYRHLYALTYADGNKVNEDGETSVRSDNFFYKRIDITAPSLHEEDWQILQEAYQEANNGDGWEQIWNFNSDARSLAGLFGIQLREGRVFGVDLSANGLSGEFPCTLLKLPYLEMLNLSDNSLTGSIGEAMRRFTEENPSLEIGLKQLDISQNQLSGNIGQFAHYFPNLESMDASDNYLSHVNPTISTKVKSLNLTNQSIQGITPLHLGNLSTESLASQLPDILLYNHASQNFSNNLNLMFEDPQHEWSMVMAFKNGEVSIPTVSSQNVYYGESNDQLAASVVDNSYSKTGTTLTISLGYDEGDVNFDGQVDILDLQATINFAFEDYKTRPFNFPAANIHEDQIINVQDVVGIVNLLLNSENNDENETRQASRGSFDNPSTSFENATALLNIEDGQFILNTNTPIASFDISFNGNSQSFVDKDNLERHGFICNILQKDGYTRLIVYSLTGATLPVGKTVIGTFKKAPMNIRRAKLSDKEANEVVWTRGEIVVDIESIYQPQSTNDHTVYDLKGCKVSELGLQDPKLKKGVYIQDGRKVVK